MGVKGCVGYESVGYPIRYGFYDADRQLGWVSREPDRLVEYPPYSFGFYSSRDIFKKSDCYVPLLSEIEDNLLWE